MAAFNRPTEATYEVHENITVDTSGELERTEMNSMRLCRVPVAPFH
jgi:hypothetical protein